MRPKECRHSGQNDLFRARLGQIVDMGHPLARLAATIDWRFLEGRFGAVYLNKPSHPTAADKAHGAAVDLKHMHDLSDEELCARFLESPYYQLSVMGWTVRRLRGAAPVDHQRDQPCPPPQSLDWISRKMCFRFTAPTPTAPLFSRGRSARPDPHVFRQLCLVALESCFTAHFWAREIAKHGHEVRTVPPQYVKPFVKRNKTDSADAGAICEAASRPTMRRRQEHPSTKRLGSASGA
jgi:hypothetical protein